MSKPPAGWLASSKFSSSKERTTVVKELMANAITSAIESPLQLSLPEWAGAVRESLVEPLHSNDPRASAAAEVAFVLCAFCLAEQRVLDLEQGSVDLEGVRLAGDRVSSEALSITLRSRNVPSTEGALQSSTYRSGYSAGQARSPGLAGFVDWLAAPGRALNEISDMWRSLAQNFASLCVSFPPLPTIDPNSLTFARMKTVIAALRAKPSGGAYEQYLTKALLSQEFLLVHPSWRVETKRVMASDASSGSAGDVQIRRRQVLVQALEVSASNWEAKIKQAVQLSQAQAVPVIVAALTEGLAGEALESALSEAAGEAADIAVVDLDGLLDVVSSRITPSMRGAAIRDVYRMLVDWGRARPDLVAHLVSVVRDMTNELEDSGSDSNEDAAVALDRIGKQVDVADSDVVEVRLDDLRLLLGLADQP